MTRKKYSKEFKEEVVAHYQAHPGLGYLSVARIFDIPSDETVRNWVKQKEQEGDLAFLPKARIRKDRDDIKKRSQPISSDEWEDPKDMQERIAFLEAENAYLKKLIALRKGENDR
jgi:transposase-like protein